jgi:hypothetical protein
MKCKYVSDEELNELPPEGEWDAVIATAEEATSKKGADMIVLGLKFWDGDSRPWTLTDYLVSSDKPFQLSAFAKATCLYDKYKAGEISRNDILACDSVRIKVAHKPEKDTGTLRARVSYLTGGSKPTQAVGRASDALQFCGPTQKDDVPF